MNKIRILLYITIIVSCLLIALVFSTNQETVTDQIRSKFGVKKDENVILLTAENERYIQLLLTLSDDEIDKITAYNKPRDKLLVICSQNGYDRLGIKSNRIRFESHPLSKEVENLPELFTMIAEKPPLNEKIRRNAPLINPLRENKSGEEKNLSNPFLAKIKQNEKDRLRLIQVLTFAFAKHQDLCYTAMHETK